MRIADLEQLVAAHEERLKDRVRELVEIESPSDDKEAVDRAGRLVQGWAEGLGAKLRRHRQQAYGDVLELRFGPEPSRKSSNGAGPNRVLLLGHLDTVWPLGTLRKMPWKEANGRLSGPGVLDMKSGVVMAIEAVAALRSLNVQRPVTLLLVSEEEVGSPISRPITESLAIDSSAVLVLEPAQGLACKTARKGVGAYTLRVEGVAAHAGVDFELGHSAVREMARLVEKVSGFTDLARGLTVNVGVIAGGTRSNVVPAECVAQVDVRIRRVRDADRVERSFAALNVTDPACRLTVSGGINRPPMERKQGTVKLFRLARRLAAELGLDLQEAATGGGSDGNFTAAMGVATLDGLGAVGAGAHAPQEHVLTRHLVQRTALLAGLLSAI